MSATQQLTIALPLDVFEMIECRVSSGEYTSESAAIEAAILDSILPPHDEEGLERWIATEGVRRYDAMRADPSRRLTSDEVFASLEEDTDDDPEVS